MRDLLVELFEGDSCFRMGIQLRIPEQRLGDPVILILQDGRE